MNVRSRVAVARNERGLSLVEVTIATVVGVVILLAATQGTIWMAKNNRALANKSMQSAAQASGSRGFASIFETASIAAGYEHMPVWNGVGGDEGTGNCTWDSTIPASFDGAAPCTAQLSGGNLYATNSPNSPQPALSAPILLSGVNYLEFFRDDVATISDNTNPFAYPGQNAVVQKSAPLSNNQLAPVIANANPFYVAWPLVFKTPLDPQAQPALVASYPLMVAQASSSTDPLIFSNITYAPNQPTGAAGRQVLMQATNVNDQPATGSIYLIYNTYDPTQYIFQYAKSVVDCATPAGAKTCAVVVDAANGSDTSWSAVAGPSGTPTGVTYLPSNGNSNSCAAPNSQYLCPSTGTPPVTLDQWFQAAPKSGVPVTIPGDTIHYFAIDLEPIQDAQIATAYPTAADLFGADKKMLWFDSKGGAAGQLPGPGTNTFPYPFLTQFASFFDTQYGTPVGTAGADFAEYDTTGASKAGAGADIRVVAHYYEPILGSNNGSGNQSIGTSAQLVAVPVSLKSLNLFGPLQSRCSVPGSSGTAPCSTFNFVVNTISAIGAASPQVTLLDHLPLGGLTGSGNYGPLKPQGAVILARQLGGSNFQMFSFTPNGIAVSSF